MAEQRQSDDSGVFASRALPRSRAWLSLVFLGAALLSIGGAIEFATGSPMTEGQGVASYWAVVFSFHGVVFTGATLIGMFPALAVRPLKLLWLVGCAALYVAAFLVWRSHAGDAGTGTWLRLSAPYLPALLPLCAGLLWRNRAVLVEEPAPPTQAG
jgi:hypothetical protein